MDLNEIKSLLDEQNKAVLALQTKNDEKIKLEVKGLRDGLLNTELKAVNDAISKLSDELKTAVTASRRPTVEVKGFDGQPLSDMDVKHAQAFNAFVRKGVEPVTGTEEFKAMASSDDPNGGYLIPRDLSGRIVRKVFETSVMSQIASDQTITTDALEGSYDDDELTVGMVGEQGSRSETSTPKLGAWRIPVHEGYAKPKATQRLLDDAAVDIEAWLAGKVSDKLSRLMESQWVNGDGVGKARGLLTYTPVYTGSGSRASGGTIRTVKTGTNGDLPDTAADKLVNLIMSLKAPYRANGTWVLSREGIEKVRLIKQDGKYLWAPSVLSVDGQAKFGLGAGTLLGYSVAECNDAPVFATNAIIGGFGDVREAYQIVRRQGIRVLRDPYSAKPFVEFYTTARWGGDVVNFEAFNYLQAKA